MKHSQNHGNTSNITNDNERIKTGYLYYWSGSSRIVEDTIFFCKHISVDMLNILNIGKILY